MTLLVVYICQHQNTLGNIITTKSKNVFMGGTLVRIMMLSKTAPISLLVVVGVNISFWSVVCCGYP